MEVIFLPTGKFYFSMLMESIEDMKISKQKRNKNDIHTNLSADSIKLIEKFKRLYGLETMSEVIEVALFYYDKVMKHERK